MEWYHRVGIFVGAITVVGALYSALQQPESFKPEGQSEVVQVDATKISSGDGSLPAGKEPARIVREETTNLRDHRIIRNKLPADLQRLDDLLGVDVAARTPAVKREISFRQLVLTSELENHFEKYDQKTTLIILNGHSDPVWGYLEKLAKRFDTNTLYINCGETVRIFTQQRYQELLDLLDGRQPSEFLEGLVNRREGAMPIVHLENCYGSEQDVIPQLITEFNAGSVFYQDLVRNPEYIEGLERSFDVPTTARGVVRNAYDKMMMP